MKAPPWGKKPNGVNYLICQSEVGEEGTQHLQGYIQTSRSVPMSWMKNRISSAAHFEPQRAHNTDDARHYCQKPVEDCKCKHCKDCTPRLAGPWEYGTYIATQYTTRGGSRGRSDIHEFRDAILAGMGERDLWMYFTDMMSRNTGMYTALHPLDLDRKPPLVYFLYGESGLGKTHWFYANAPKNDWWCSPVSNGTLWMSGYKGEKWALFDDFSGQLALTQTLRLFDRWPIWTPTKGGHTDFKPEVIVISSNRRPDEWYKWDGRENEYLSLCRRLKEVYNFNLGPRGTPMDRLRVEGCYEHSENNDEPRVWYLGPFFGKYGPLWKLRRNVPWGIGGLGDPATTG